MFAAHIAFSSCIELTQALPLWMQGGSILQRLPLWKTSTVKLLLEHVGVCLPIMEVMPSDTCRSML